MNGLLVKSRSSPLRVIDLSVIFKGTGENKYSIPPVTEYNILPPQKLAYDVQFRSDLRLHYSSAVRYSAHAFHNWVEFLWNM